MTARKTTKLTVKQQRFVDAYDGNATQAARKAGYKQPRQAGAENMSKRVIRHAIEAREKKRNAPFILTRQQRQELWSQTACGQVQQPDGTWVPGGAQVSIRDRLHAAELLGKSEADFTDKSQIEHGGRGVVFDINLVTPEPPGDKREQQL